MGHWISDALSRLFMFTSHSIMRCLSSSERSGNETGIGSFKPYAGGLFRILNKSSLVRFGLPVTPISVGPRSVPPAFSPWQRAHVVTNACGGGALESAESVAVERLMDEALHTSCGRNSALRKTRATSS